MAESEVLSAQAFAAKVKEKYPEYKDVDNLTLAKKMVEKYPEYSTKVSFEHGDLPLTKDVGNTFGVPDFQESETIMADGSQTKPISALNKNLYSVTANEDFSGIDKTQGFQQEKVRQQKVKDVKEAKIDEYYHGQIPATSIAPNVHIPNEAGVETANAKKDADDYLKNVLPKIDPQRAKEIEDKKAKGYATEKDDANLFFESKNAKIESVGREIEKISKDHAAELNQFGQLYNELNSIPKDWKPKTQEEYDQYQSKLKAYNDIVNADWYQYTAEKGAALETDRAEIQDWAKAFPYEAAKQAEKIQEQKVLDETQQALDANADVSGFTKGATKVARNLTQGLGEGVPALLQSAARVIASAKHIAGNNLDIADKHAQYNFFDDVADDIGNNVEQIHSLLGGTPSNEQRGLIETYRPFQGNRIYTDKNGKVVDIRNEQGYNIDPKQADIIAQQYDKEKIKPQEVTETNKGLLLPKVAKMVGDLALFGPEIKAAEALGAGKEALTFVAGLQGYESHYQQAKEHFKGSENANSNAEFYALGMSAITGKLMNYGFGDLMKEGVLKEIGGDYLKNITNGISAKKAFADSFGKWLKGSGAAFATGVGLNEATRGLDYLTKPLDGRNFEFDLKGDIEGGAVFAGTHLLMSLPTALHSTLGAESIYTAAKNPEKTQSFLDYRLQQGTISKPDYERVSNNITQLGLVIESLPNDMSEATKAQIVDIANAKNNLELKLKNTTIPKLAVDYKEKIAELDNQLNSFFEKSGDVRGKDDVAKEDLAIENQNKQFSEKNNIPVEQQPDKSKMVEFTGGDIKPNVVEWSGDEVSPVAKEPIEEVKVGTPEEPIIQQTVTNEKQNEPTNPKIEGATPSGDNAVLETPKVEQVQAGGEEVKVGDEKQEGESYYRKINRITQDTPEYESMDVFQKVKHIFSKLTGTDGGNGSSKYHGFELPNGEVINLRVSDHTGNYEPNGQYVFSIVIDEDISGDKPRISNGENYTEVRLSADNKEVKNDLENYVLDIISDIEKVDSKKQVEEQVNNVNVPENEHNASLDALNNEAKKHGYIGIKQLNSAESTNENASPEIKKLLSDYGEHANKVKSIKNSDDVSSLNDDNFGLWAKANNVEYNEQGNTMPNERNLKAASLLHEVFTKRNDIKSANKLKKALELSRKKDNWTKESWNERWDEDLSDDEISNINKDNAEYNSQLDDVLSEINSSKSGTSALESKKTSNKVLEKTIEEENANNKGISDNEADKGNEGEVIADKESKNDKAGEGDGGDKKSDLDVPKNQKSNDSYQYTQKQKNATKVVEKYDKGKTALEKANEEGVQFDTPQQADEHVAANSENPSELAEAYARLDGKKSTLDHKGHMIEEYVITLSEKEFEQLADKNLLTKVIRKKFIREKKGAEASIDVKLQELSDIAGVEITPEDLINHILNHELNLEKKKVSAGDNELRTSLKTAFQKLTGEDLTPKLAKKIVEAKLTAEDIGKAEMITDEIANHILENDLKTVEDAERLRFMLGDEVTDLIINDIKQKQNGNNEAVSSNDVNPKGDSGSKEKTVNQKAQAEYDQELADLNKKVTDAKAAYDKALKKINKDGNVLFENVMGKEADVQHDPEAAIKPFKDKIAEAENNLKKFEDDKENFLKKYDVPDNQGDLFKAPKEKTKLEQAKEDRKSAKEKLDAIKESRKNNKGGIAIGNLVDTELANARHDYHKATVKEIKEWLKEKAGSINDYLKDTGEKLTIALKTAWDEANGGKKIEKPEDLPYTNEDQPIIGITRAHIDPEQIERGLDKSDKLFKSQKNPELWDEIKKRMVSEPDLAIQRMDEISQEIAEGKSPKFSKEDAVIGLHERVRLKVERKQILSEQKAAIDSGNKPLAVDAALKLEQNSIANERNNLFIETATSTYGGGLQSSQMLSTESYDYTSIKNRIEAEQGKPLSAEQEKQFKDISEKYQQFQDKLAENETKFAEKEKEYQKKLDEYHEELQKARTEQAQKSNKKEARKRPVDLAREAEKERLRKILGIKSRSNTNALFDPSTIINKDFIKYHKMVFEDAIGDFRHFTKEMIKDFGNGIKEHLPKLFKDSGGTDEQINAAKKTDIELNGEFDILTKKAILDADGEFHEGLKGVLDKMFNNRVEAGETDYKKNVQSIYDALEQHIKDLDKNDLGDLIGGYGKFKELTKDPAKLLAAEGRRNLVLDAKLREVNKGVLPKRNGQQRALKTKAERDKETAIAKGIREQNLTPEPNEQEQAATYASELESYHRSLERQIEDYDAEGKSGVKKERTVGIKRSEKFTDTKSKELEAERDRVKAIRDAVLKERAATELEKTVKRAKQLTDDINKAKKEGRTKDAEALQKEKDLTDGEIGNLVNAILGERTEGEKKIDSLRKQIDDVLNGNTKEKTTKPELTDAEKQQVKVLQAELQKAKIDAGLIEKPLTAEEKQLESLQNQLDDLYAGKVKETADKKVDSAAVKELKDKIAAQKELMGLKAAKSEAGQSTINAIQKGIDDINAEIESLNSGTFDKEQTPNTRGGVTNFKTVKEKNTPQLTEEAKQKIRTLQGERDALQEQKNNLLPQIIKDKALIAKDIKQKQRRLTALKALVESGRKDKSVYKTKVKEPFHPSDPRNLETRKMIADKDAIMVEIKKLENEVAYEKDKIAKANAGLIEKGINELSKVQRFMIFANPWGMGRLAYAAMMRPLLRVPTEIAKLTLSNLPYTREIMRKAPSMYRPSIGSAVRATKSYYSNYFAKATFKNAITEYNKRSNYSLLNDETYRADRWDSKYDFIMAAPEMSHGFMKAFPKIAAHESAYVMALENLSKTVNENTMEYYDITDPRIQHLAMQQAHMEAYADVFMSDAEMPQLTRNFLEGMITSKNLLMQASGLYGKQLLPVIKVPANFYHEVIQQIPGVGALDAAQIIYRSGKPGDAKDLIRGIDNLTPEQAHKAARAIVNQTVGLMVVTAGMALYKEYGDEAIKKLEEYEHYVHSSAIPLLHMGLRMGKDKAEGKSILGEGAHTFSEETFKLPQVKAVRDVSRLSYAGAAAAAGKHNWDNATKQAKQMLATLLIPSGAAELAKRMDDERKRDPKTFKEILEMRIPGLRDLVPSSTYESSNSGTQKFLEDKGIEITRFSAEPDHESGKEGTKVNGVFIPLTTEQEKKVDAEMEKIVMEEIESRIKSKSNVKFVGFENGELKQQTSIGLEGWKLQGLGKENLQTQIKELKERAKYLALVNLGYIKIKDIEDSEKAKALKEEAKNQELINNK